MEIDMRYMKKSIAYLLAVVSALSMTACGSRTVQNDIAGDDWRASGIVVDQGTIIHDGESVDVLVTVSEESAAFYWDMEEQVLYDSVAFPMTIPDAEEAFSRLFFDDVDNDGESDVTVNFYHEDGSETHLVWIWDPEERYVFQPSYSYVTGSTDTVEVGYPVEGDISPYVGLWEYIGANIWLRIYDDATWEFMNSEEDVIESGVVLADAYGIELHFDGSGDVMTLESTAGGDLLDNANGGTLCSVEAIVPTASAFERNGLSINCAVDGGTYLLQNGVCSYSGLGDGYNTDDCYWEVIKNEDYTHDGMREIQFDAICYIPDYAIPYFDQQYMTVASSELFDYYSGMWLTAATAYNTSERGDNHYIHTVNWNAQSYDIEFFYSVEWIDNVGDWAKVLKKSYIVYMPEDYDGLIFAAVPQPNNYNDCAKLMQLDSISPEAGIETIDLIDCYNSLYFSICD